MGNGNFKVRCIEDACCSGYTVGKVYEIIDGKITTDSGYKMPSKEIINTFEDWKNWSCAKWELVVEDSKQENKGCFKAKCVETRDCSLTIGKIYEFVDGYSNFDSGMRMPWFCHNGIDRINNFYDLVKWFSNSTDTKWELVVEDSSFDWDGFKAAKFAVHCDTEEKAKAFLMECDEQGIKWIIGKKASELNPGATCYCCSDANSRLEWSDKEYYKEEGKQIVNYDLSKLIVKEVNRPAKIGEWIKIVEVNWVSEDDYKNGDIFLVDSVDDEGDVEALVGDVSNYTILRSEYVVLENYQPNEPIQEEPYKVDWLKVSNKEIAEELLRRYQED